jgi:hypothetical protein
MVTMPLEATLLVISDMMDFGHWGLVIGDWSLAISHWRLAIGHWGLVIGD